MFKEVPLVAYYILLFVVGAVVMVVGKTAVIVERAV